MARIPSSTYRLQLHEEFGFDNASAIAPYLKKLGVTHVYSSPYLQAAPHSRHGYDVVDHRKVNEELGGAEAHERFCKTLGEVGLGQVLDIVPNHMSLGRQNRYWWDVLENGTNSRYAGFFDIDWNPNEERLRDKVLVPILGDQYGRVLRSGGVKIKRAGPVFTIVASEQELPISPTTLPLILNKAADRAGSDTLRFLAASFGRLPSAEEWDRWKLNARDRDKRVLFGLLSRLCLEEGATCHEIDNVIDEMNASPDTLDELLSQQNYRLSYWKTADQQLGYRRFFDVNTLIGVRMEREYVFEETHALILKWVKEGVLDGLRVDHPDGLRDPLQYFDRLRKAAPEAWIIGEKILEPGELLRPNWPIQGTSGYDFMNQAIGLLVQPEGLLRLGEHYTAFTGDNCTFPVTAHDKKLNVTQEALGSDVNRLASVLVEICEENRDYRDFTRAEIRRAIREVASCFSIYRTYVVPPRKEVTDEDREIIRKATECAKNNRQDIDGQLFDFMAEVLQGNIPGERETEFVYRFQQFTSPVMAKGVEDTAFYCYNRLTALNEVGGNPACSGFSPADFHHYNTTVQRTFPQTMLTLSTHDTKRSDDVRARIAVLSEIPDAFAAKAQQWHELSASYRGEQVDTGTEWFLFQTLIGAWPITVDRLKAYMQKAMREAKLRTTWTSNNAEYEDALNAYMEKLLEDKAFTTDLEDFVTSITYAGRVNSLAQTLLKHTSPGVPDLYQGGELWDLSLVDPDNRRPVDYELRSKLLDELHGLDAVGIMARIDDGLPKLHIAHRALNLRQQHPDWFGPDAAYLPLEPTGPESNRLVAYERGDHVITIVPRWVQGSGLPDASVTLPDGQWTNELTGEVFASGPQTAQALLKGFPVALLIRS
ncbi:MAG TPA: malto-oligosyltrehalose synthase [Acidobacteriaceae bacterium]|nr:malto-oligosyltrehalose synthase [Acidobacteriaceae bacterium]